MGPDDLDDRPVGVTPITGLAVPEGKHELTVSAERYQTVRRELEVAGMGQAQSIELDLRPDWAPVSFSSQPSGASVRVDETVIGMTPLTAELPAGKHTVTAEQAQTVPTFVLRPASARLALTSEPVGATVTVDGTYQGATPLELSLAPAVEHRIVVTKAGHETVTRAVTMAAASQDSLSLKLPVRYGQVFITSDPADAELFVDGQPRGRASQRLRLSTAAHTLEFRKPGYQSHRVEVTPRAGVSKELSISLKPVGAAAKPAAKAVLHTPEGQVLKLLKPGRFTMGASRREQGRRANENLRHVELTRPFYLSVKEVSNAEFRRFKADHNSDSAYGRSLNGDGSALTLYI